MPPKPRCKRRFPYKTAVLISLAITLVAAWFLKIRHSAEQTAGVYLTRGGRSILVLDVDWLGKPVVKEGGFPVLERATVKTDFSVKPTFRGSLRAFHRGKRLLLKQSEDCIWPDQSPEMKWDSSLSMVLEPSQTAPGDWDLVDAEFIWYRPLHLGTKPAKTVRDLLEVCFERLKRPFENREVELLLNLDPARTRVESFLHRVDDPRLIGYFEASRAGTITGGNLAEIREFFADHSDDPYLQVHRIDFEAKHGNVETAESVMNQWRERLDRSPDVFLKETAQRAFKSVWKARGLPEGEDLRELIESLTDDDSSLARRMDLLRSLCESGQFLGTSRLVVEPASGDPFLNHPNLLSRWFCVPRAVYSSAILDLFQGRRKERLDLLAGLYRFGQMLNADGGTGQRCWGILTRSDATIGLRIYALNACVTPEDFLDCWRSLTILYQTPGKETGETLFEDQIPIPLSLFKTDWDQIGFASEIGTIHPHPDVEFELVRAAVAAKYRFLTTGQFPRSASEFAPLLPEGPPQDLYSYGILRFLDPDDDSFTVYSVGPDGKDDGAAIQYDPTNGFKSVGDLLLRIPRNRTYPFPPEGVRAADAAELLERFPYGLPGDGLSPWRSWPLGIVDSTTETPVVVFSFGPTLEGADGPWSETTYRMPGLRQLEPDTPRDREIQKVLKLDTRAARGRTVRDLVGPTYDPTNGAQSQGRLFVELAK